MPAGATYEPIATSSPTSVGTVDFSSLGSYTDIRIVIFTRQAAGSATDIRIRFNSDTGTNYSFTELYGTGAAAASASTSNASYIAAGLTRNVANIWNATTVDIFNYAGATNKTVLTTDASESNGSGYVWRKVGLWRSTSAITTITVSLNSGNFATGTTISLYGIKAA